MKRHTFLISAFFSLAIGMAAWNLDPPGKTITPEPHAGDLIGTVKASDQDTGSVLTFEIIKGNYDGAVGFGDPGTLGPDHTGQLRIHKPDLIKHNRSRTLVIKVQDNGLVGTDQPEMYSLARVRFRWNDKFVVEPFENPDFRW